MRISAISCAHNYSKINAHKLNLKNESSQETIKTDSAVNKSPGFKGKCEAIFGVLGGLFGAAFANPITTWLGVYAGVKWGKKLDDLDDNDDRGNPCPDSNDDFYRGYP